jgi:hypothetical protein
VERDLGIYHNYNFIAVDMSKIHLWPSEIAKFSGGKPPKPRREGDTPSHNHPQNCHRAMRDGFAVDYHTFTTLNVGKSDFHKIVTSQSLMLFDSIYYLGLP